MDSFYTALARLAADKEGRGVLVTIESTRGSAPRKAGAAMLMYPEGVFSGTVGGGILEYRAQREAGAVLAAGVPARKSYSLGAGAGEEIGAICGGSAELLFRPVGPAEAGTLLAARPERTRVLLYGAGHVGRALAELLHLLDMEVVVTDERAAVLTPGRFPNALRRLTPLAEAPVDAGPGDPVVIMTHGHTHDYTLLRRAFHSDAAYIGVMASRRKGAIFRERLLADGVPPEEIRARLHTPVGLAIGAETPEEIAVSIAAELIAFLRGEGGR